MSFLRCEEGALRDDRGEAAPWPRLGLLGWPVRHSLSPRLHDAALAATGRPGRYQAVEVPPAELGLALVRAHAAGVGGLNLTLPHKESGLAAAVEADDQALRVGAANTLVRVAAGWRAHNTDVGGLEEALTGCFPTAPWRGRCCVVGAGGAARAAVAALQALGAGEILVLARRPERAAWARAMGAEVRTLPSDLGGTTLLLQATPLGLDPEDPSPVDPAGLDEGACVMDLCYGPGPSRLLRAHAGRGPVVDGRPLLLAQAARAFALWFPGSAPHAAMAAALPAA